jgi:hypothetical protein
MQQNTLETIAHAGIIAPDVADTLIEHVAKDRAAFHAAFDKVPTDLRTVAVRAAVLVLQSRQPQQPRSDPPAPTITAVKPTPAQLKSAKAPVKVPAKLKSAKAPASAAVKVTSPAKTTTSTHELTSNAQRILRELQKHQGFVQPKKIADALKDIPKEPFRWGMRQLRAAKLVEHNGLRARNSAFRAITAAS